MLWSLIVGDWQGTLIFVVGGLAALAALIYIPAPLKHYAVATILILAAASKLYSLGYADAEAKGEAILQATLAKINDANEKATIEAVARAKADAEANVATVRQALDAQAAQAAAAEAAYQDELAAIGRAPASTDGAAPLLILKAIRGQK